MTRLKSKPVRLSGIVLAHINSLRSKHSYDVFLRKHFGLPDKRGKAQPLREYFIIPNGDSPFVCLEEPDARGLAVQIAVQKKTKKVERVLKVRELP